MKSIYLLILLSLLSLSASSQLVVNFSASPQSLCVGSAVTFTDLSTSGSGAINSWSWNFGDGNTSSLQNPSHTYSAPGTYNITLTASNGTISVAEVKANYITVNPLPNVSFSTPATSCSVPYAPIFSAVTPSSGTFSYSWDFGNGQTSTSVVPTNANYTTVGTFNTILTVTNTTTGCVNSFNQNISVFDYNTDFSISTDTVCAGQNIIFQDLSTAGVNSWFWDFGNGVTSGLQNPSPIFPNAGSFTVTLTSQNTTVGCSDSQTQNVVVLPLPQPSFTGTPLTGCDPLEVDFTNTSVGTGTFNWNFGNGSIFTGQNPPTQTYSNTGTFNVILSQTDANGCVNSIVNPNYIVVSSLIPNFEADVLEGCEILEVQFTDLSTSPNATDNPITGWQWDFGNGNTFSGQNPPLQLFPEGVYTVTLTITTDGGCSETITLVDYIKVGIPPIVSFTYTPIIDCAKSDFDFISTTVIPPGYDPADVTWDWDFGDDSGTSTEETPTYNYPVDTGYFDVQLIVSFRGCKDTLLVPNAVYIKAPIALFSPSQTVFCNPILPLLVEFSDDAILGADTDNVDMIWTWGDGDSDTLFSPALFTNPDQGSMSHTYTSFGTFQIQQLIHNYTTGCDDSITQTIHVSFIDADFTVSSDSACRNGTFNLANTSNSTHPITTFQYNMGNGVTLSGANQNPSYSISGMYDITLNITNSVGCTSSQIFDDFVALQEPTAQISPSAAAGCVPLNVVFTNNSTISGNGVGLDFFNWTFEDGTTQVTNNVSQTTSYNFTSTGSYTTTLIATDDFGCVSSPHTITTVLTAPTAAFTVDPVVCNLENFSTNNISSNFNNSEWFLNGTSVSNLTNYASQFDELNPGNVSSIIHDLMLIVTDANGCRDTSESTITVSLPQANASYDFTGANVNAQGDFDCPPVFADLEDSSSVLGTVVGWQWTFGDNNSSTLQDPSNTYVFAGTYTATLAITDNYGCTDNITFPDYLTIGGPSGVVDWTNIGTFCNPQFEFNPTNLVNVFEIQWIMGNGDTLSNTESFTYLYENMGNYVPSALIIDDNNCEVLYQMDPISINITAIDIDFSVNPNPVHIYNTMTVSENSTGGSGGIVSWDWSFGSESFSSNSGGGFGYEWQKPGQYSVTLIVTDSLGCTQSMTIPVFVTANLHIPNVLTANGDGINDFFMLSEPVFTTYDIIILNRWGNVVSELYDQNGLYLWDGKNQSSGEMCVEGTYFYKLTGTQYDGVVVKEHGTVTLVLD